MGEKESEWWVEEICPSTILLCSPGKNASCALDAGTFSLLVARGRDPTSFEEAARRVQMQSQGSYHAERRMVNNYVTSSSCSSTSGYRLTGYRQCETESGVRVP